MRADEVDRLMDWIEESRLAMIAFVGTILIMCIAVIAFLGKAIDTGDGYGEAEWDLKFLLYPFLFCVFLWLLPLINSSIVRWRDRRSK